MKVEKLKLTAALLAVTAGVSFNLTAAPTLKVGDPAPKLQTGKWVQGDPVKDFEKGKAYIVEFWATWCPPCRASIPHLNETYGKFKDKGLIVIGQDCWERDESEVAPFVKKMGDKMTYRVALDDKAGAKQGQMAKTWMEAAGRDGIPADATAVTGNVTATDETAGWAVYLGPDPIAHPSSSTVNFTKGATVANGLTVALSGSGTLSATYMSTAGNRTDLVFDVTGFFTADGTGATYHPLNPLRLLDTRSGNGLGGPFHANSARTFAIAGRGTVPSNATAITANVTAVNETSSWAVYVGPDPIDHPTTSTVNFSGHQVQANSLIVALSETGTLSATYMSKSGNTTDLVLDVTGYFTDDATGARFVPVAPVRLLDTRSGNGLSGKLSASSPRTVQLTGRANVLAGATAITGNVTVTGQNGGWAVYIGPEPVSHPGSSTLNFIVGDVKANGVNLALGSTGTVCATFIGSSGKTTNLILDVTGYFVP